ncbi:hypothetical protein ROLI_014020 [Roseobacter fucihabitans]|uniref:Uncharacterized protein n=1 Tax=Roseobacter fucihabitans TaxID=1537242 RepID=A0ABZ2BQP6_9RHOB|nr:TrbI/VirB10 family protein [Roseobacter litoralis]MBC6967706.1 Type IV secretion system protein virB10 [Roseobacter litoralis]
MKRVNITIPITLTASLLLNACATYTPPEIDYDSNVPALPTPPPPVVEEPLRAIHTPPPWTPSRGGDTDAATAEARVINANAAARVEPRREGYYNAIQVFPYSEGALYQIYAAPGQITNIALEPGEQLTGAGPIAAGDTTRWIIGDTESGNGRTARVHILVKPTRPDIFTNLVINTDRRTYLLELRANEASYMPSVAWSYPPGRVQPRPPASNNPRSLRPPASPYVLQAGSIIPAALVTGIRSDHPGQIVAQVTQNVYDSPSGRYLLLPQGSRLIGEYDNGVGFGQRRILLVWTRIILPDGQSIVLERQPGADSAGYAGLEDGVDHHWGGVFRAAALSTLLNISAELGADDDDPIASAIRDGAQDTIGDAGREIVRRQIDIPPTLTIRPGFPVRVIVTRDLILQPQGGH